MLARGVEAVKGLEGDKLLLLKPFLVGLDSVTVVIEQRVGALLEEADERIALVVIVTLRSGLHGATYCPDVVELASACVEDEINCLASIGMSCITNLA